MINKLLIKFSAKCLAFFRMAQINFKSEFYSILVWIKSISSDWLSRKLATFGPLWLWAFILYILNKNDKYYHIKANMMFSFIHQIKRESLKWNHVNCSKRFLQSNSFCPFSLIPRKRVCVYFHGIVTIN